MIDTCSKWGAAFLLAAAALLAAGCDQHSDTAAARQLQIASADLAAKSGEEAVGTDQSVEDSTLTTLVREAIAADRPLQSQHIHVETADGAVTLRGVVDSQALRDRAVDLAGSVDGVALVQDRLGVRS